jgi:hypothetical protein
MSEFIKFVEKSAPLLGDILTGSTGGIIGVVTELIANIFGADPKNTDDILAKMQQDPDSAKIKLQELQNQHEEFILSSKASMANIEIDSQKDAREMELEYQRRTGRINPMIPVLVGCMFGSLIGVVYCLINYSASNAPLLTILTVIATKLASKLEDIYDMYFGGISSDSDSK